jgi:hypothetical protein
MRMKETNQLFKLKLFILINAVLCLSALPAMAGAGWYPTFKGDVIHTQVCLPKNIKSPIYLQLMGEKNFGKTVAVIHFKKLPADSYCRDTLLHDLNPQGAYFDLKFDWKVNVTGGYGLQFYSPKLKKAFYGWPDGVSASGK